MEGLKGWTTGSLGVVGRIVFLSGESVTERSLNREMRGNDVLLLK